MAYFYQKGCKKKNDEYRNKNGRYAPWILECEDFDNSTEKKGSFNFYLDSFKDQIADIGDGSNLDSSAQKAVSNSFKTAVWIEKDDGDG